MKRDITIEIDGTSRENSLKLVETLQKLIEQFSFLDLRRLNRVIISQNIKTTAKKLEKKNLKNLEDTYALVLTLPTKEEFELLLIVDLNLILNILKDKKSCEYKSSFHILHHEFAHIHDNNKKIDNFKSFMKDEPYKGVLAITCPIAELCWSEYIANFISSSSAIKTSYPKDIAKKLIEKIDSSSFNIKTILEVLRVNRHRDDLLDSLVKEVESLFKTASYLIGYLNGFNITFEQLDDKLALKLEKSYFSDEFYLLVFQLNSIHQLYPYGFINLNIYKELANTINSFFKKCGVSFIYKDSVLKVEI